MLLLDCRGFRIASGERAGRSFYVFVCVGIGISEHGEPSRVGCGVWTLCAQGPGGLGGVLGRGATGSPKAIVGDADRALRALWSVFADAEQAPEHRLCEWHLSRKLREHLPDSVLKDPAHPITTALPNAFHTTQAWADLLDAIHAENNNGCDSPLTLTLRWLATYGPRVEKADRYTGA